MLRWTCVSLLLALTLGTACAADGAEEVDELLHTARSLEPNMKRGRALFTEHCVECHGVRGKGNPEKNVPVIARQRQAYVIKQFADIERHEREAPAMHRMMARAPLDTVQAWVDVAAYVNNLKAVRKVEQGDGQHLQLGEAIFRESCASCHGADARGDADGFVPSLRNQHYTYLLRAMRDLADAHRSNVDEGLTRFLSSLDEDEMQGLADYLSRIQGKTRNLTWLRENGIAGD